MCFPDLLMPCIAGDTLVFNCYYNTMSRTEDTVGGEATTEEMCYNFLYYYPAQDLMSCIDMTVANPFFANKANCPTEAEAVEYSGFGSDGAGRLGQGMFPSADATMPTFVAYGLPVPEGCPALPTIPLNGAMTAPLVSLLALLASLFLVLLA